MMPHTRRRKRTLPPVYFWAVGLGFFLSIASLSNLVARYHPFWDLLGHFKPLFTGLLCLPWLVFLGLRRWPGSFLIGLILLLNGLEMVRFYRGHSVRAHSGTVEFKILQANVLNTNPEITALARLIRREQPDIVALMEFNPRHLALMNSLARAYPYRYRPPDRHYFGLGLWSKYPLHHSEVRFLGQAELPVLGTWVDSGARSFYLLSTHLDSPVRVPARHRNRQLEALGQHILTLPAPLVVLGDLNVSLWSPYFKALETRTGLLNCRSGFGILPSWPVYLPRAIRIPIDHCLISPDLNIVRMSLGEPLGSDHLPLLISLRFQEE